MIGGRPTLGLFVDQNVAESAARAFETAGHSVRRLSSVLPVDASDDLVAATALAASEILVTHDQHFRISPEKLGTMLKRHPGLSVIHLACAEPAAAARLKDAMSLLEHEWTHAHTRGSGVMRVEIRSLLIRIAR